MRHRSLRLRILGCAVACLMTLVWPAVSVAHWADFSVAEIVVGQSDTHMTLTVPTTLLEFADGDQNGQLSPAEIQAQQVPLETFFRDRILVRDQHQHRGDLTLTWPDNPPSDLPKPNTHSTVQLTYTWSTPLEALTVDYHLFVPGLSTARCLATITAQGQSQQFIFTPQNRVFTLQPPSVWQQVTSFVHLGIEHIFTGYDHILFLLSLMLFETRLKVLLKLITAFTVAHSLTLGLSTLQGLTLPAPFVESLIALSIVYVAIENLWRHPQQRGFITFGFGLIHGLGFAGILRDLSLSDANLPLALVSFNLGVELGQVAILSLAFWVLLKIRQVRSHLWMLRFQRIVAVGIASFGLYWFFERALSM